MDFIFYIHWLPLFLLLRLRSALGTAQSTLGLAEDLLHREKMVFFISCVCGKAILPTCAFRLFRNHSMEILQPVEIEGRNDLRHIFLMFSHFFTDTASVLLEWILSHLAFIQASNSVRHKQWVKMVRNGWKEFHKNTKPQKKRWLDMTLLCCFTSLRQKHDMKNKISNDMRKNICNKYSKVLVSLIYEEH